MAIPNPWSGWTDKAQPLMGQKPKMYTAGKGATPGASLGKWNYQYKRDPQTAEWNIRRKWEGGYRADDPDIQEKFKSASNQGYRSTTKPSGWDPTASQFPWQARSGISSDYARQRAFSMGIGTGRTPSRLVARSSSSYFDPRSAFRGPSWSRPIVKSSTFKLPNERTPIKINPLS